MARLVKRQAGEVIRNYKSLPEHVELELDLEEFEYVMMGLHALVKSNLILVDEQKGEELAAEHPDTGELVKVDVQGMFIGQHVDISKLLDQLAEGYGYDPAVEG